MAIFHELVFRPLYNLLVFLYDIVPDLGVAIILVTIIIKVVLIPVSRKQIESQKKMQELQPKIKEVQEKYKNNRELQSKELIKIYKEHKANPLSGCLPLVVQIIVFIALFRVFISGLNFDGSNGVLYGFVSDPGKINPTTLGLLDLSAPNVVLAVVAAAAQYVQTKMLLQKKKKEQPEKEKKASGQKPDFASMMNRQMLYLGPLLTLFIGIRFASGLVLYWLVSTLFMIGQQYLLERSAKVRQAGT